MPEEISVAEAKSKFSEIIARTAHAGDRFIVKRRKKPVAAIVSINDLRNLSLTDNLEEEGSLLSAAGAWSEFEYIDKIVEEIYKSRTNAKVPALRVKNWL